MKLHGSLLLQSLLKFQNKRIVVNGFMALSTEELKTIICQPAGSYLLEHFMSNERIKDKKKEQLIHTMKVCLFHFLTHFCVICVPCSRAGISGNSTRCIMGHEAVPEYYGLYKAEMSYHYGA